jgi:LL-diaminopimelate aminotransferase
MEPAERIQNVSPYFFVGLSQKVTNVQTIGREIISFAEGDPDLPMPQLVIDRLTEAARSPISHRYPEIHGMSEFRTAVADWYWRRFRVRLDPDREVVPLLGAKEGIAHAALAFVNPGDVVLIPDPAYPVYEAGTRFAGGKCHFMPLREASGWWPDFGEIPEDVARRSKVMWLNYPNNPTGASASLEFFDKVVHFAKARDILVLHDAAYADVIYDDHKPLSLLQVPDARSLAIEFYSLSKTFNMAGWRVAAAVGRADALHALFVLKSYFDSGLPSAIQCAAIKALRCSEPFVEKRNRIYQQRRDRLLDTLAHLGFGAARPGAGLYVWARTPDDCSAQDLAAQLLSDVGLVVVPGDHYGKCGERHIRFSLTVPDVLLETALERLKTWRRR